MPAGTVGLLLCGLFAASMSSMDSALNKNAGILVRSVYQPFLAKRGRSIDDKKLLRTSMIISFVSGVIVILMALFFRSLKGYSLFDLMMSISSMIQVPLLIPLILGLLIKKTPSWAPWVTVILGLFLSWFMKEVFTPEIFAEMIGIEPFTDREATDMNLILTLGAHVFITAGFFCATSFFYDESKVKNKEQTDRFFKNLETPVIADDRQHEFDTQQRNKLGAMVMCMVAGVFIMVLIPNPVWGRAMFVACALVIFTIGFLLKRSAKNSVSKK